VYAVVVSVRIDSLVVVVWIRLGVVLKNGVVFIAVDVVVYVSVFVSAVVVVVYVLRVVVLLAKVLLIAALVVVNVGRCVGFPARNDPVVFVVVLGDVSVDRVAVVRPSGGPVRVVGEELVVLGRELVVGGRGLAVVVDVVARDVVRGGEGVVDTAVVLFGDVPGGGAVVVRVVSLADVFHCKRALHIYSVPSMSAQPTGAAQR
jgi:hypothetical protein